MRGELVIVRAFGDKPLKRRIWAVDDNVVFVTNEEEFYKLTVGIPALEPIGFPKEDIFKHTENESWGHAVDWSCLVPWE